MATFTIRCGPAHKSRRQPQRQTIGTYVGKISTAGARKFSAKPKTKTVMTVQVPAAAVAAAAPQGAWSNGRFRPTDKRVTELRGAQKPQRQAPYFTIECRYCHEDHQIRVCPKLAEKNRRRAEWADKEAAAKKVRRAEMTKRKREMAEALLAERVRKAMEKKNPQPVEEESDSDSDSDSDYESDVEETPQRRVTFANDSDCLMKPEPTQVKEFHTDEPATAVSSSDEEDTSAADADYFASKRTAGAWRPRRREVITEQDSKVAQLKKELAAKEKELAGMGNDSWADAADYEELEEEIEELKEKLGMDIVKEEPPHRFQNMLTKIRRGESEWDDNEPSIFLA